MTHTPSHRLDHAIANLAHAYPGPGGAVAVLRDGEVLIRHAWGFANAERRIAFTPGSLFRMCSITKQFTCAVVLDAFSDPSVLDPDVAARLPGLQQASPGALHLAHNQSGLRDYWALAMLHGASAESRFGQTEADRIVGGARTLQFTPGTRYAYCNQNFRLLSEILEARTGRSFAELLATRIFEPVGMASAFLAADTRAMPDGSEGYEGAVATGFRPAQNNILWTGDAGLGASLDDMIAWERHIDQTRDDTQGLYRRLCAPVTFDTGAVSEYGFGLNRRTAFGQRITGHGGALRGWRSHRLYAPDARISVVVMFNHLSDAHAAAMDILAAALNAAAPPLDADLPPPPWLGAYVEPETGLAARIESAGAGQVLVRFGHSAEVLNLQVDGSAGTDGARLRLSEGGLWMDRPQDNFSTLLSPLEAAAPANDVVGAYHCAELAAAVTVVDAGGALYGGFSGFLGQGRMERLQPIGPDVWALPCPRALDHTPPGDWTLSFARQDGLPVRVTVGCWLARGLIYQRKQ